MSRALLLVACAPWLLCPSAQGQPAVVPVQVIFERFDALTDLQKPAERQRLTGVTISYRNTVANVRHCDGEDARMFGDACTKVVIAQGLSDTVVHLHPRAEDSRLERLVKGQVLEGMCKIVRVGNFSVYTIVHCR